MPVTVYCICVLKLVVADCCLVSINVATGVSLVNITDWCLSQHQTTTNFYVTVSYKLNASVNKFNNPRLLSLNPKQSEISPLNGDVGYYSRKILVSTQW